MCRPVSGAAGRILTAAVCLAAGAGALAQDTTAAAAGDSLTLKKLEALLKEAMTQNSASAGGPESDDPDALEIDGLVIDETRTKVGRDFYTVFYSRWEAPDKVKGYTIYIGEKPMPRMGSWISIKVNDNFVYQSMLKPNYTLIENTVAQLIPQLQDYLVKREMNQRQLSGEDMTGSGIY